MTVSENVKNWLKTFYSEEHGKNQKIATDVLGVEIDDCVLIKEPVKNVKSYVSGRKVFTEHYQFNVRLSSDLNSERIENIRFGESMEKWVEEQRKKKNYPEIENAETKDISITTPFYMGATKEGNSVYQLSFSITYERNEK